MITMTKTEAETKLNKTLTNNEYIQYIYKLNFGSKKQNALKKAWKWLNKPHELRLPCWWITKQQKIDFLKSKIANAFGDYDF